MVALLDCLNCLENQSSEVGDDLAEHLARVSYSTLSPVRLWARCTMPPMDRGCAERTARVPTTALDRWNPASRSLISGEGTGSAIPQVLHWPADVLPLVIAGDLIYQAPGAVAAADQSAASRYAGTPVPTPLPLSLSRQLLAGERRFQVPDQFLPLYQKRLRRAEAAELHFEHLKTVRRPMGDRRLGRQAPAHADGSDAALSQGRD